MKDLRLATPIILVEPTLAQEEITADTAKAIKKLCAGALDFGLETKTFYEHTEKREERYDYGCRAAIAFLNNNRLPYYAIEKVARNKVLTCAPSISGTQDLIALMIRVGMKSSRVFRLRELEAPEIIMRNEERMLYEAVNFLFCNGHVDGWHPLTRYVPDDDEDDSETEKAQATRYCSVIDFVPEYKDWDVFGVQRFL